MDQPEVLHISDLISWSNDTYKLANSDPQHLELSTNQVVTPFDVNEELNNSVYLWSGDVTQLEVDCLVLPINEILQKATPLAVRVCQVAGPSFERNLDHVIENGDLKTSAVQLSEAHNLPCKQIMQAMEPRVNDRFITGVETALHNCYCQSLQLAANSGCRTIALTPLCKTQDEKIERKLTHVAIRTLQCCLKKLLDKFDAVVMIAADEAKLNMYKELFCSYFPRSNQEAASGVCLLPQCRVGEWGEVIHPDREIRITDLTAARSSESDSSTSEGGESSTSDETIIGKLNDHSFTKMSGDHDEKRRFQLQMLTQDQMRRAQERIYRRLLRLARTNNLSQIAATNALYLSGEDHSGSPVVVLIAKYMNVPQLDLDQALLYFIHILDSVVDGKYSIVYFHSMSQKQNRVPSKFVEKAYNVLDPRYKTNLKYLYIVHPTFWSKLFSWMFTTFSASDIKKKLIFIKNIPQIFQFMSADQIDIPPFIWDYDMQSNPTLYPGRKRRNAKQRNTGQSTRVFNSASSS